MIILYFSLIISSIFHHLRRRMRICLNAVFFFLFKGPDFVQAENIIIYCTRVTDDRGLSEHESNEEGTRDRSWTRRATKSNKRRDEGEEHVIRGRYENALEL